MEKIKEILEEILDTKISNEITRSTSMRNDLGLDSLNLAQLTVLIEEEFDVDIFADGNVETIGEILDKIEKHNA